MSSLEVLVHLVFYFAKLLDFNSQAAFLQTTRNNMHEHIDLVWHEMK